MEEKTMMHFHISVPVEVRDEFGCACKDVLMAYNAVVKAMVMKIGRGDRKLLDRVRA